MHFDQHSIDMFPYTVIVISPNLNRLNDLLSFSNFD